MNIVCMIWTQVPMSVFQSMEKTILMHYSFCTQQILKLFNSWIYNHIPTHKPKYWSLPPFHKRAVNTTCTSCCTKSLLSILHSKKTPNFTIKIIHCVILFNLISCFWHGIN
jgi:hypothetical protein